MTSETAMASPTATRSIVARRVAVAAIVAGAAFVAWWPFVAAPPPPDGWLMALAPMSAHVAGMLAGYGLLVLLTLMSRSPVLERQIGADTLTRWHALGARVVLLLILVHAGAAIQAWAQAHARNLLASSWDVVRLPGLVAATIATVLLVAIAFASVRRVRSRIAYERWHGLHLLTYVAVAMGFFHQLAGPDLVGHRWLQITWSLAYVHVFALVLRHRVLTPLRQANRHRLRVTGVTPEGDDAVSIEVSGRRLRELGAESGQFFRWRFLTPDHWRNAHPFSLSAPPTDRTLRLTVKALGPGSRSLQDISVGTWVVAEGPYGVLTKARRRQPNVLLIAGGVGITPLRTLFETLPVAPGGEITLLYRARRARDLLLRRELDEIARRSGRRVHYLVGPRGDEWSPAMLRSVAPDVAERDVFLCGPPGMTEHVRQVLAKSGVPPSHLHEERFAW